MFDGPHPSRLSRHLYRDVEAAASALTASPRPSRPVERRASGTGARPPSRTLHLGAFDGERKRRNAARRAERQSLAEQLAGLAVTVAILFLSALILGAV